MSLQDGDRRIRALLEIIDDLPVAMALFDRDMRFLAASRRCREDYGLGSDCIGRSCYDVLPELPERWRELQRRGLAGETLQATDDKFVWRNGRHQWLNWEISPWKDGHGDIGGIIITAEDVTQRKEMEVALFDSEAFWRSTIDASPIAIITIDEKGRIVTFSRAAEITFGYREAEVGGRNVHILMPEPDHSKHDQYMERYLDSGEARIIGKPRVVKARRKDGEVFPASLHVSEFEDGRRIFVGFVIDVSHQAAVEQRLAETQTQLQHAGRVGAMGEMATTIAHEINQPLTAAASLAGAASVLLARPGAGGPIEAKPLIDDAVSEIQRASEILRQMRDFLRKRKTARSLHDVNKIIEDASAIALLGASHEGIHVSFGFAKDVGSANIDRIQIQQVITNLIRNAVDAMKDAPEKRLSLSTARKKGMIEITVADTGSGVADGMKRKIFESFVTTKDGGLGVGLAISRSIVDLHQGEISVRDNDPRGAVFTVRLPVEG
ncbi:MAG: PAS domain S-box protein [Parvularculaceae bacterium]